jgi:biotin carboxyl carrier protein
MKYEILVNGKSAELLMDGEQFRYRRSSGDIVEHAYSLAGAGEGAYSVLCGGRSYSVASLGGDEFSVNGRVFRVEVFDPRGRRARRATGVAEGRQAVAAPMPGRVIRVLVEAGQTVEAGQGLIVVEAMKMQNEMKSPKAGRVIEVKASDGATVAAGDILVEIE